MAVNDGFQYAVSLLRVRARGSAEAGRRDTLKEYPRLMASSSVSPTCERGGSINTEYATGLRSSAVRSLLPKRSSRIIR